MTEHVAKRSPDLAPTHPGELLREDVILNCEQPVTPAVAVRLGNLFGNGPGIWLRMQVARDQWHAEREVDVSNIPTLKVA